MKKNYIAPSLDINVIDVQNIIATSPVTVSIGDPFTSTDVVTADSKVFNFDEEDAEW